MSYRERRLSDHLAGMRGDDRAAEQPSAFVVHAHEAVAFLVDDRAIDLGQWDGNRFDTATMDARVAFIHADVRDLGIGVRAPRDDDRTGATTTIEQGVLNDHPRHDVGGVRELELRAHVAGRIDATIRRLEPIVHDNALLRSGHSRCIEAEAFDVGCASSGYEHAIAYGLTGTTGMLESKRDRAALRRGFDQLDADMERDAVLDKATMHNRGCVGILVGQHAWGHVEHRDGRTETREGLRQFAADWSRADDKQSPRQLGQRKHRFAG